MIHPLAPLALALGLLAGGLSAQTVHHVDDDAAPGGDGSSWAHAFADLQDALDASAPGDQVWVAVGTYRPSVPLIPGDPRSAAFVVPPGRELYGGFDGHEARLGQRAGRFAGTVLSGDLGASGHAADNAYRVVVLNENPQNRLTRIDGFQVRDGNADGPLGSPQRGGGVFVTLGAASGFGVRLDLRNCILRRNHAVTGGALGVEGLATVDVTRCRFSQNSAEDKGGAVIVQTASLRVTSAVFDRNTTPNKGGAVYLTSIERDDPVGGPRVRFVNSLFVANRANRGGAAFLNGSNITSGRGTWSNCVFDENEALDQGGAFFARTGAAIPAELTLTNSILWRNTAPNDPQLFGPAAVVESCVVRGGHPGAGNLDVDPGFVDLAGRDYRTVAGSPAHDAGSNAAVLLDVTDLDRDGVVLEPVPFDAVGAARFRDDPHAPDTGAGGAPVVDIGLFEF